MKQEKRGRCKIFWIGTFAFMTVFTFGVPALYATNGYFSHGYGLKYKALAGAGVALRLGPLAAPNNPAAMAFIGNQYDFSISLFNPNRHYSVIGNPTPNPDLNGDGRPDVFGLLPGTVESDSKWFVIPSLAANWTLNASKTVSLGVSIFGNGGMNTNYDARTFGFSPTGVDLSQLFVAPTLSIKVAEKHGFGLTPILAYQRFEAKGLQAFGALGFSSAPTKITNNEHSSSTGFGVRVGYLGEWMDFLSVGAAFQTKVKMSEFDDYTGLFTEQGDFDIPANWTVGVALGPDQMRFVFDVQQILYSEIASVGNPLLPNLQQARLGDDNGAGFGWDDMTVFKGGVYFQTSGGWTWRAGYSFGEQPIPGGTNPLNSQVLFNILAPGVIEQHLTVGFSKTVGATKEINIAIMRAFSNSVSGLNPLEISGQQIELKMDQWEFGVGFSF